MTEADGTIVILRYQLFYYRTHSLTSERTGVDALTVTFRDIYLGAVHLIECRLAVRDVQESMATFPCGVVDPAVIVHRTRVKGVGLNLISVAVCLRSMIPTRVFLLPQHLKSPIV